MCKRKDLKGFDRAQIVVAQHLGQSIFKTAGLDGCSCSAVIRTYQKWKEEELYAHADPCPPPTASTMDHGGWKRGWRGLMNHVFFFIMWMAECVYITYLWRGSNRMHHGKKLRLCDAWGNVPLLNLGSIHLDVTSTLTTSPDIDSDLVPPFMETFCPSGLGSTFV